MFRLLCFAIIRLLHYLLDTYMCESYNGWDILVIPRESVVGNVVYKLMCPDCHKAYVGQTGRRFSVRYREHQRSFRDKTDTSRYAKHLNENGHSFGPIKDILETLQFRRKGIHLNTVERFYIHKESITNYHLNDPKT
jgi:hypothetical protein